MLAFAADFGQLPFDVAPLRAIPYRVDPQGNPADAPAVGAQIAKRLREARNRTIDSPLFQLLQDYPNVAHEKTDVFRERVRMSGKNREEIERRSKLPKAEAPGALREFEASLGTLEDVESAVLVALFLAYRDAKAFDDMVRLAETMPEPLGQTVLVREQYAFALNRKGEGERAEKVLKELLEKRGPSSETFGLLGRVYKDRYSNAIQAGNEPVAGVWLTRAIDAYLQGFEADWRDDYPGVNAVTLMAIRDRADPRLAEVLPVVRYAAKRRVAQGKAGYWGHATLLELAVIAVDEPDARARLAEVLAEPAEPWMRETTLNNLRLLREAGVPKWIRDIEAALVDKGSDRR